jgi:hypothetical protein
VGGSDRHIKRNVSGKLLYGITINLHTHTVFINTIELTQQLAPVTMIQFSKTIKEKTAIPVEVFYYCCTT